MTNSFSFYINSWSAWAPGLVSFADWQRWSESSAVLPEIGQAAAVGFLPPLLRRRCSKVTRAALAVAWATIEEGERSQVESVFASRHGEAETTLSLLRSLAEQQDLSPTDFGLSVHNTTSGIFSLAANNRRSTTAISSGENTLAAAFIEAYTVMHRDSSAQSVLLVIADEPLPQEFRTSGLNYPYYAVALYCSPEPCSLKSPKVTFDNMKADSDSPATLTSTQQPEMLLRFLFETNTELQLQHLNRALKITVSNESGQFSGCFQPTECRSMPANRA